MAPKAKQPSSNVKSLEDPKAVQAALTIKMLNDYIDKSNDAVKASKETLLTLLRTDCQTSLVEEGTAYGCYQIPVPDGQTGEVLGEVVEVLLSVDTKALEVHELATLQAALGPDFKTLFEDEAVPTALVDAKAFLDDILLSANPSSYFKVDKGKMSLVIDFNKPPKGLAVRIDVVPRNGFFVRVQTVLNQGTPHASKAMADWLENRTKISVRTQSAATTNP